MNTNIVAPNDFWYTPPVILTAVKKYLGSNYFDPCPINPKYDGLSLDWGDNCFINPPYSNKIKQAFIDKGRDEYCCGRNFLWLVNYGNLSSQWKLLDLADAILIPEKRIKFTPGHSSLKTSSGPRYNNMFILWGKLDGFAEAFQDIGKCYREHN